MEGDTSLPYLLCRFSTSCNVILMSGVSPFLKGDDVNILRSGGIYFAC